MREIGRAELAGLDHASVGQEDREELQLMKDFQHRVSDMLAWMADTLMPQEELLHREGIDGQRPLPFSYL